MWITVHSLIVQKRLGSYKPGTANIRELCLSACFGASLGKHTGEKSVVIILS